MTPNEKELVETLKLAHGIIDALMARLVEADREFMPSKARQWPTIIKIVEVLRKHGAM